MKILSNKTYQQLNAKVQEAEELKGFYDGNNAENEYLQKIASQMKGLKLPNFGPLNREQIKKAYETCAPVNGVIDYIADNVGEVMKYLELRRVNPDGTYKYIDKHWLLDRLRKPNDRYNLKRFGKAWAVNRLLFDDAEVYAPLTQGKDRQIDPTIGMYVLPGQKISVKEGGLLKPFEGLKLINASGDAIDIEGKIFQSFGYNLDDTSYFGTSKIVAAAVYLSVIDKGMRRQDTSLDNGGASGIITPKADSQSYGIMPADADNVEKEVNGKKSFNKLKALRTPIEYHAIGSSPVDLAILGAHKEAVTALCFVYHIPVDLYYGQSKYENAKEAKKAIYEQQAIPMAEEFGADLLSYVGLDDEFELVVNRDEIPALQETPTEALDRITKMHGSLNELRTANGFDRIEEPYADEPMIPLGIQFGNETYDIDENA